MKTQLISVTADSDKPLNDNDIRQAFENLGATIRGIVVHDMVTQDDGSIVGYARDRS